MSTLLRVLRLWRYLFKYKVRFFLMIVIGLGYGVVNTSLAGAAGFMVKLINPEIPDDNAIALIPDVIVKNAYFQKLIESYPHLVSKLSLFHTVLAVFLFLVVLLSVSIYLQNYFGGWISTRVTMDLRKVLAEHLLGLDFSYFVKSKSGDIITRISSDLGSITAILNMSVVLLTRPFALLVCLVYVFYINWQLALWGLIGVPVAAVALRKVSKKIRFTSKISREKGANVTDVMIQFLRGMGTVKSFNCEKFELDNFNNHNEELFDISAKQMRATCSERPITSLTSKLGIFLVVYIGGNMVLNNELYFENIVSFIAALSFMYSPGKELSQVNVQLQGHLPGADRVFEILDAESKIIEGDKEIQEFNDKIEFKNIGFSYIEGEPVISDFSLTVNKGETVALVGASGAGKSTIINLILRLFDIQSGQIVIDGIDIKDLTFASLREQLALVGQSPFLFSCSVADNISYGRHDVSRDVIVEAGKAANIHNEIMALPEQYDQEINENGENFSGGQRQRLSIARAICKNAPVLLLDEATSALDSVNEKQVQNSIDRLMAGKTTIVVAHRLSTVKNADKIVMMAGGRIIGIGNHADLTKSCPEYAHLVELQGLH